MSPRFSRRKARQRKPRCSSYRCKPASRHGGLNACSRLSYIYLPMSSRFSRRKARQQKPRSSSCKATQTVKNSHNTVIRQSQGSHKTVIRQSKPTFLSFAGSLGAKQDSRSHTPAAAAAAGEAAAPAGEHHHGEGRPPPRASESPCHVITRTRNLNPRTRNLKPETCAACGARPLDHPMLKPETREPEPGFPNPNPKPFVPCVAYIFNYSTPNRKILHPMPQATPSLHVESSLASEFAEKKAKER